MVSVVFSILLLAGTCFCQTTASTTVEPKPNTTEPVDTGLRCYACFGVGPNNECENYTYYEKAWKSDTGQFDKVALKKCSAPYNVTCIITTYVSKEGEIAHLRDCSDDHTFGFPKDKKDRYAMLKDMASDNQTKCAWDGEEMICLTKCNSGNFCNGPQLAANTCRLSWAAVLAWLVMYFYGRTCS